MRPRFALVLCASIVVTLLVAAAEVRSQQPASVSVIATVSIVSSLRRLQQREPMMSTYDGSSSGSRDEFSDPAYNTNLTNWHEDVEDYVVLRCPETVDTFTRTLGPEPQCNVPIGPIVQGNEEVEAFMTENKLNSGDTILATFDLTVIDNIEDPSLPAARRRRERMMLEGGQTVIPTLRKGSIQVLARNTEKEFYSGSTLEIYGVVYLLEMCGWKSYFRSAEDYRKYMFSGRDSSPEETGNIQNYYRTCSHGKVSWKPENVIVVGPITIDCSGNLTAVGSSTYPFNTSQGRCSGWDQWAWQSLADAAGRKLAEKDPSLARVLGRTWPNRRRSMVVVPWQANCGWAGLAYVNGDQSFIRSDYAANMHVVFHELGHNFGLQHATSGSKEYGDSTDPMGNTPDRWGTNGIHCHNAPYNWRLGWAGPVPGGDLTAGSFTPRNNRLTFTIPASSATDRNMVIVNLATLSATNNTAPKITYPRYFLSYRTENQTTYYAYDGGLSSVYHQKVIIHSFDGLMSNGGYDSKKSAYIDAGPRFKQVNTAFPAGNVWTGPYVPYSAATGLGGGLRVRVVSVGDSAVVEVCRMFVQTEGKPGSAECQSGLDLDCDGLTSFVDPDCTGVITTTTTTNNNNNNTTSTSRASTTAGVPPPPARSPPRSPQAVNRPLPPFPRSPPPRPPAGRTASPAPPAHPPKRPPPRPPVMRPPRPPPQPPMPPRPSRPPRPARPPPRPRAAPKPK